VRYAVNPFHAPLINDCLPLIARSVPKVFRFAAAARHTTLLLYTHALVLTVAFTLP